MLKNPFDHLLHEYRSILDINLTYFTCQNMAAIVDFTWVSTS